MSITVWQAGHVRPTPPSTDLREREQQALELNDRVLQGLVVALMALELDQPDKARAALTASIDSASQIITGLLGREHSATVLVRREPAHVTSVEGPR